MKNEPESEESEPCPVCKTDRYLNPNMILLVNLTCYHKMCQNCINRIYAAGSAPCPICKTNLRKQDFIKPTFDNVLVEKECRIRKRVFRIFNKTLDDFDGNLRAYNDYLEQTEDIVFNLLNDFDVIETNAMMEQYARENAEIIRKNTEFQQQESLIISQILEEEKRDFKTRKEQDHEVVQKETLDKIRKKQAIIDQLAASTKPAAKVIKSLENDDEIFAIGDKMDLDEDDRSKRGPSLLSRLSIARRNMMRVKNTDTIENPFPDPLESSFIRNPTPFILTTYQDPSIVPFEVDKYKAGGFSSKVVYKKALETLFLSLHIYHESPVPQN